MTGCVLVTGATGYLARHVIRALLAAGRPVRATIRDPAADADLRAALGVAGDLSLVEADLRRDAGWRRAMRGCGAVLHLASPVPLRQPEDRDALLVPAVEGTRRVLQAAAAAGVGRAVVVSSVAAMLHVRRKGPPEEADWSDPDDPVVTPYERAKILAERAAWEVAGDTALALTTLLPGIALGPGLGPHVPASVRVIRRVLSGKDPMQPNLGLPLVDVRDVAAMLVAALDRPQTAGRRLAAAAGFLWMAEIAATLREAFPDRRIATRVAPDFVLRGMAMADPMLKPILPHLGRRYEVDAAPAVAALGVALRDPRETVVETGRWLAAMEPA